MSVQIRTDGWARIEGCEISDLRSQYGTFNNMPNTQQHVYYNHPEVQIECPYAGSTVYCVKPLDTAFGITTINGLDANWAAFINNVSAWMNNNPIDISDPDTDYYWVGHPFTVNKSSIIFYAHSDGASLTGRKYGSFCLVLVDESAFQISPVISIVAKYNGNLVPVGEAVNLDDLEVTAIYDNGQEIQINTGYTIDPADRVVTKLGANVFTVYYEDPEHDINTTTFIVQGCRNLESISGTWDGGMVKIGREADRKFFLIIAHYTDGTESTVTDFSFPNGNVVTNENEGIIQVYYKGKQCDVQVDTFQATTSRLVAFYNGPNVEVGDEYLESYISVKIYYATENDGIENYVYEDVDIEDCTLSSKQVLVEGVNSYNISYVGELGEIQSSFTVIGFTPEVKPTHLDATYTGPSIYQGKTYDLERVLCNIYYSDGKIRTVKNFTVSTNIVHSIGSNEITVTYTEGSNEVTGVIFVNGIANDDTTENNIFPTQLNNNYPRATILNNRYRGPAEGVKTNDYAGMIIKNINSLYKLFASIETQYNQVITDVSGDTSTKIRTLNNVSYMDHQTNLILKDDHYTTGVYKSEVQ